MYDSKDVKLSEMNWRNEFLHLILTGNEKWCHYHNPKVGQRMNTTWALPHIDCQTEYPWRREYHAVCLMWPAGYGVLWDAPIKLNNQRATISNSIHAFEPNIEGETATIRAEVRHDNFAKWQPSPIYFTAGQEIPENGEMGSPTSPALWSRLCNFWLLLVLVDVAWPGWEGLLQIRKRYLSIVSKMEESWR